MSVKQRISYKFNQDKNDPNKRTLNIWTPSGHWFVVCQFVKWYPKADSSDSEEKED